MSDENKKDVEKIKLTKELLQKQVSESKSAITQAQNQVANLSKQIEQQFGVLQYAEHLLARFDIPNAPEEPKKSELEVK